MFSNALTEFVKQAEASADTLEDQAGKVVQLAQVINSDAQPALLIEAIRQLRKKKLFDAISILARHLTNAGYESAVLIKFYAQALIEQGQYILGAGALKEARAVAFNEGDAATEADAWGLEGRIYKDLFLNAVSPGQSALRATQERLIRRSVKAYNWVFMRAPKAASSHYHGVNAMAVMKLGARHGFSFPDCMAPEEIAELILEAVGPPPSQPLTPETVYGGELWDYANSAEACAALDRWDDAISWINHYMVIAADDEFALNGTLRQFEGVWGVDPSDPQKGAIVTALRMALISAQDGGLTFKKSDIQRFAQDREATVQRFEAVTPSKSFALQNEKVLGVDGPFSLKRLEDIMLRAKAVGRVNVLSDTRGGETIGTGFLLPGERVDASLASETLFFTNAHVLSDTPARDESHYGPGDAYATFDLAPEVGELQLDNLLWCSGQHDHDVSVFLVKCSMPGIAEVMKIANGLPKLKRRQTRLNANREPVTTVMPGKVYVIGHPLGQDLSFSLNDNDLIDHEAAIGEIPGPEPRRIHYRAPTKAGNSGSPVFNSRTLELIGVHHRGGQLARLNGASGKYAANEGMWIRPAINALRLHLDLSGDMFSHSAN
ncbi:MAG: serine protease [Henriciella sp.]|nr:serine protease [Henriciella sp.]